VGIQPFRVVHPTEFESARREVITALRDRVTFRVMTEEGDWIDGLPRTCADLPTGSQVKVFGDIPDVRVAGRHPRFVLILTRDPETDNTIAVITPEEFE